MSRPMRACVSLAWSSPCAGDKWPAITSRVLLMLRTWTRRLIDRDYCVSLVKQISSTALSLSSKINMDLIQLLSTRLMWFNFRHHLVRLGDLLAGLLLKYDETVR